MMRALAWGGAIGTLGGLIGLGGAEFRLPVLLGLFALAAHAAVRLNLLMSLVTLAASALARFGTASFRALAAHVPEIVALTLAAMTAGWFGAGLLARIAAKRLTRLIAVLLAAVGGCLRGLVRDNVTVAKDAKVVEVDPRGDPALCFGIGERPRLVAASVAELLAARLPAVPDRIASGSHP
jgi:hypothetical protein